MINSTTQTMHSTNNDIRSLFQDSGLAKFTLRLLYLHATVLTNNDMSVRALLSDCCIDDTRSSKINNQVRRYMKCKLLAEEADDGDSPSCSDQEATNVRPTFVQLTDDMCAKCMIDFKFEKKNNAKTYRTPFLVLRVLYSSKVHLLISPIKF